MTAPIDIHYRFHFEGTAPVEFAVSLDSYTLLNRAPLPPCPPAWAELNYERCPNCTLDPRIHPWCPTAAHLVEPIEIFSAIPSFARTRIEVEIPERTMSKHCSVQEGLSSLFGIYMTSSGCPMLRALRPMVRFHLPFASREETVFRAAATWLIGQYLREASGGGETREISLRGLSERYRQIGLVNTAFSRRIQAAAEMDASLNAIVLLDCFAKTAPLSIENGLREMRAIFSAWED